LFAGQVDGPGLVVKPVVILRRTGRRSAVQAPIGARQVAVVGLQVPSHLGVAVEHRGDHVGEGLVGVEEAVARVSR